jgi:methyl-accepting chemotaxis protein
MNALRRLPIAQRLLLVTLLVAGGVLAVALVSLVQLRTTLMDGKIEKVHAVVEAAHGVLQDLHASVGRGERTEEAARSEALRVIARLRYEDGNYLWINDMQPVMVMHPIKRELDGKDLAGFQDPNGKHLFQEFVRVVRASGQGTVDYYWPKPGAEKPQPKVSYVQGFAPWGWIVGSGVYVDDVDAAFWESATYVAGVSAVLLVLLVAGLVLIARSIVSPLRAVADTMGEIAHGDGDLTHRLDATGRDEVSRLCESFNEFVGKSEHTILRVADATRSLNGDAEGLAELTRSSSTAVDEQRMQTQQVATAVTEMSATTREIARSAEDAAGAAQAADGAATQGRSIVDQVLESNRALAVEVGRTTEVVERLNTESVAIGGVVGVIQGIAEQTNLLALNAAIEAARAGEQGRGFAVVADEVRTLASRTKESTTEIQKMIENLQGGAQSAVRAITRGRAATEETVQLADSAKEALGHIVAAVATIKDMNTQIASAAEEQTVTAQQIDRSLASIAAVSEQSAKDSREAMDTSRNMALLSRTLDGLISQFKVGSA